MDIGNRIKQLRHRSGLTQEQLANKLCVSAQSVSKWENAVAMPDIMLLPILAEEFGVSIDELFDLTVREKLRRIENRLEKEEELSADVFKEYEIFLLDELSENDDKYEAKALLAHLYPKVVEHNRLAPMNFRVFRFALTRNIQYYFVKSRQNPSKIHSTRGVRSFAEADFFESKILSRREYADISKRKTAAIGKICPSKPIGFDYFRVYHHRMQADARRVERYAEDAIMMCPEKKDCQWLLNMAAGQRAWDWNVSNHARIIDFYKRVTENDTIEPKTPMPYYYLIDNLLADGRTKEAERYLRILEKLPACNPILVPIYRAHIALSEHDAESAEEIIAEGMKKFEADGGYLFEVAQYYAGRAEYEKAVEFYERSWNAEERNKPRFTDALEGLTVIYEISGEREMALQCCDRIIRALKEEWGYSDGDLPILKVQAEKRKLLNQ